MSGWRDDVSILRGAITGEPSNGWRGDIEAIARSMGETTPKGWRQSLRYIRQHYSGGGTPPEQSIFWDDTAHWGDTLIWQD